MKTLFNLTISAVFIFMSTVCMADETFFFWYGSAPDSVSWAPFDWEEQGRASGFATSVELGEFWNHTPDAGDDVNLNRSLVFGLDSMGNIGAHHPTVLPGWSGYGQSVGVLRYIWLWSRRFSQHGLSLGAAGF